VQSEPRRPTTPLPPIELPMIDEEKAIQEAKKQLAEGLKNVARLELLTAHVVLMQRKGRVEYR
jgi:hypothetical protein